MASISPGWCRECDVASTDPVCWICGGEYGARKWPSLRGAHEHRPNLRAAQMYGVTIPCDEGVTDL